MMGLHTVTPATIGDKKPPETTGLALWMSRVLEECDRAGIGFEPGPVHDLRVALRRCRSVADGFHVLDPDPAWKQMKKAGKSLFSSLGELRDTQVMDEWVRRLSTEDDPARLKLLYHLSARESELKLQAAQALHEFDRKQWKRWSQLLPRRTARIRKGGPIFKHLALERWAAAYELHQRALRNRSQVAFHNLRIGIKRFRYIVENFLPEQHAVWKDDLKELQDLLGEVHDLDVLWAAALRLRVFPDPDSRASWHTRIREEREYRIARYREKMLGNTSLWQLWRRDLPQGKQVDASALARLGLWASALDPDAAHRKIVVRLAIQLYDGLFPANGNRPLREANLRRILHVAALLHNVGRSRDHKAHHKDTYRLIQRLSAPYGWTRQDLDFVAAITRFHRGALPQAHSKFMNGLSSDQRRDLALLAGILRLANAFDAEGDGRIQHLELSRNPGFLTVAAEGYSTKDRLAEKIAAGRHLLETVCRHPILIRPLRPSETARASRHPSKLNSAALHKQSINKNRG